jgi:pimeloyl-ACP methyl ester carboxylesterase
MKVPLRARHVVGWLALVGVCPGCLSFQQLPLKQKRPERYVALGNQHGKKQHIYVEQHGPKQAKQTLLLVHGFGATGRSWHMVLPALSRHYRVLVVDLPGFGYSDKYRGDYSITAVGRKVWRVADARGAKKVHLVCHSWGTAVCLGMALERPKRVESVTLISSFAYEAQLPPFLKWAKVPVLGEILFGLMWDSRLDDRMAYSFYDPEPHVNPHVVKAVRALMKAPGAMAASLAVVRGMDFSGMQTRYHRLARPVMVISGKQDAVTRLPAARRLVNDLPNARHVIIPRCGHVPFIEHPAPTANAILRFIKQLTPAMSPAPSPSPASAPARDDRLATSGGAK